MRLEQSFVLFTLQGKSRTVWKMDRIQPFFSFATSNSQIQSLFKRSRAQTIIKVGQDGAQSTLKIDWKAFIWMQGFNVQFDEYYTLIAFNYFYQIYIFNSFLFSKSSLNKNLLNIYLIEVDESDNGCQIGLHEIYISIKTVYLIFRSKWFDHRMGKIIRWIRNRGGICWSSNNFIWFWM